MPKPFVKIIVAGSPKQQIFNMDPISTSLEATFTTPDKYYINNKYGKTEKNYVLKTTVHVRINWRGGGRRFSDCLIGFLKD